MKNILLFLFCFPLSIMYAQPKFTVADVFTDNMVLQQSTLYILPSKTHL